MKNKLIGKEHKYRVVDNPGDLMCAFFSGEPVIYNGILWRIVDIGRAVKVLKTGKKDVILKRTKKRSLKKRTSQIVMSKKVNKKVNFPKHLKTKNFPLWEK